MKAVLICGGLSSDLLRWFWQSPMESVCAGMPRPSWNIIDVAQADFLFSPFWERSDQQPSPLAVGVTYAKILDFGVKAGIGLLNNPRKHRTGKACTLVKQQLALLIFD